MPKVELLTFQFFDGTEVSVALTQSLRCNAIVWARAAQSWQQTLQKIEASVLPVLVGKQVGHHPFTN